MNSALQCLINIHMLRDFLLSPNYPNRVNEISGNQVTSSLKTLIQLMWPTPLPQQGSTLVVAPHLLKYHLNIQYPQFSDGMQHDAQEFLQCLMSNLHDNLKANDHSVMIKLFHGQFKSTLDCPNPTCRNQSTIIEAFSIIPLDAKPPNSTTVTTQLANQRPVHFTIHDSFDLLRSFKPQSNCAIDTHNNTSLRVKETRTTGTRKCMVLWQV